jgi:hypothetical protein
MGAQTEHHSASPAPNVEEPDPTHIHDADSCIRDTEPVNHHAQHEHEHPETSSILREALRIQEEEQARASLRQQTRRERKATHSVTVSTSVTAIHHQC